MSVTKKQVDLILSLSPNLDKSKVEKLLKQDASFLIQELKERKVNDILKDLK